MKIGLIVLMLLGAFSVGAEEIVVLTETKVLEFTLPDGSVLTNAYAWRTDSRGIMIMHDGGSYFLNYQLLPEAWKQVYLHPEDAPVVQVPELVKPVVHEEVLPDPYKVSKLLTTVPGMSEVARNFLLKGDGSDEMDQNLLMLGVLQNLIEGNLKEAKRFMLFIEEQDYELDEMDLDKIFQPCTYCGGDGKLTKICTKCRGTGKCSRCDGTGKSKSIMGKKATKKKKKSSKKEESKKHSLSSDLMLSCTACRGTGHCPACKGRGHFTQSCPKCKGKGRVVNKDYCEILRNRIIRDVIAMATPEQKAAVTTQVASHVRKTFEEIPGIDADARAFYLSKAYQGGMETNLVLACLMYSLQQKDFSEAKRFNLMVEVLFPDDEVLEINKYLKPCKKCDGKGWIETPCSTCKGTGKCPRCNGEGVCASEIDDTKTHCTACRGTGKCFTCGGKGVKRSKCAACKGRGNILDEQRVEIKLGLLVRRLNRFYQNHVTNSAP